MLFVDVVGFTDIAETMGAERAYFAVTGAVRIIDEIARRHGGAVDKFLSDCLLAMFGYPAPIPNAAAAAAAAAVEMRDELRAYNTSLDVPLRLVIGINTGELVAGDVRGRVAREFNILGDAVNVAARLKAKAPYGHVYVGPETEAESRDAFEYRPLGTFALKGKQAEVPIFELVGARARTRATTGSHAPLVGRTDELARLGAHLERLAGGTGGTVLVIGEHGIGTSRLLLEAQTLPQAARVDRVRAAGSGGADHGEARLLASLLAALAGEEALAGAPRTVDALAADVAIALERRSRTRPVAVLLDEVHRADPASLSLLPRIANRLAGRPVLFLVAARPETDEMVAAMLSGLGPAVVDEIRLGPLSRAESVRLIDAVGDARLSEDSRALVLAHGEGHPGRLIRAVYFEPALRAERERATAGSRRPGDTERRRATVLFADITGFTSLTERAGTVRAFPIVVGCLQVLDEVARKHGGTVEKLIGDCVMALFGFPEALEDAPRAAVNAAIEMRRQVRAYNERLALDPNLGSHAHLDVHIGINTGLGIGGDVAGALIREFAVMGDPVNIADELKDLAPAGRVFVGAEMWKATRDVFAYHELPPAARKGGGAPLRVFELVSDQERLHRARIGAERRVFSPLVGRERELETLRDAVARLATGHGGIGTIVAVAGLGKSRLLREVATSPEAEGVTWCEGRSVATGRHLAYHAIVDLCRSLVGIEESDGDASALAKLEALVAGVMPDDAEEALPFLAALLALPLDEARRTRIADLHGDAMEKLTLRSVTQLLRAASRDRPLVAVMDDLHWADLSSIELLESVLRLCDEAPILFLGLCRPGYPSTSERIRARARAEHADRTFELELAPLDASAARSMLNHLFRQGDLPRDVRQRIEEKAHGNPFFIEEVVRSLVDEGAVEHVDGRFRATVKIASVTIPDTIHEVVMARVDSLDAAKRQLLQTAAVIGASFHTEVLSGVVENVATIADDIDALLAAEFLVRSESLRDAEYDFKHPLIQEVTYESLLLARREVVHRKVAETLERVFPEDVPGYSGMLAYHYGKGGAPERAEEHLFRAGAAAARAAAPSEALHFFEEASKLYLEIHRDGGDPVKRALLERNIAEALYYRGRFLEAIEHFNVALRLLGDRVAEGSWRLGIDFARNLVAVLARLYGPSFGGRLPPATARQREIMDLRYARAEATVTTQPTRHLFDSMDTLAFFQRIDPRTVPGAGKFYAGAAALFAFGGISFDVARRLSERAHALVPPEDVDEWIYERAMHVAFRALQGDWSPEHEIDPERIAESVRNGQLWGPTTYLGLLGEKRIQQGDLAGAHACIAEIDRIWDLFQYDLAKTNFYYLHSLLPLEESDWTKGVEAANAYYDENPEDLLHILALGARAKAETALGELDVAEATIGHAAEIVTRLSPVPPFHGSAYHRSRLLLDLARLEAAARAGDRQGAARWRRRARKDTGPALRSAARVGFRRTELLRLAARAQALFGRRRRALRAFERAIACGEALGARPETARAWADVARLLAGGGARFRDLDAGGCRERARATFEALGLRNDLARLERE
ncbi:MAG: AAA family ATPase [Deltaproteobacteria bacterium]|nr:AAA family ATPase [Deltaproteobacteria bacterium]